MHALQSLLRDQPGCLGLENIQGSLKNGMFKIGNLLELIQ